MSESKDPVKNSEKTDDRKKEDGKKDSKLHKNVVDINPMLSEAKSDTVVLGWGRMNPPTVGHEKLVKNIQDIARKDKAMPKLYLSQSTDPKKNPLPYTDKIDLAQRAFGSMVTKSRAKTIIQVMQELDNKFDNVILVVGQDRVKEFERLLTKYNGKDYTFDSIKIVSAGDRDPDAEGVEGMSASKMRAAAKDDDFDSFKKGVPSKLRNDAEAMFDMVRAGMKLAEELEELGLLDLTEALNASQRRKRALVMRRYRAKLKNARRRMSKRRATGSRLKKRARRAAIRDTRKRVAGRMGAKYNKLNAAAKASVDRRVKERSDMTTRTARRLIPKVRRANISRLTGRSVNEAADCRKFHQMRNPDGTIKTDLRFKAYKKYREMMKAPKMPEIEESVFYNLGNMIEESINVVPKEIKEELELQEMRNRKNISPEKKAKYNKMEYEYKLNMALDEMDKMYNANPRHTINYYAVQALRQFDIPDMGARDLAKAYKAKYGNVHEAKSYRIPETGGAGEESTDEVSG